MRARAIRSGDGRHSGCTRVMASSRIAFVALLAAGSATLTGSSHSALAVRAQVADAGERQVRGTDPVASFAAAA